MHVLLFDIDGTLIRGFGLGRLALERAFEEIFCVPAVENPAVREVSFNGRTDPHIVADMARALGIPDGRMDDRREDFDECYLRHLVATVDASPNKEPCPGVEALLESLHHRRDVLLGLLTGNMEQGARIKLAPFDLNRYFHFGGFGYDGPDRPAVAARARERAELHLQDRLDPGRFIVVGDTVHDVHAGKVHGFRTVAVETGWTPRPELDASGADAVFVDLTPEHGFPRWLEEQLGNP